MRTRYLGSLIALALSTPAFAQTGVSDDRVSLPDGPGSIEGLGDDARIDPNMGQMSYSIPIELPAGFPGATPSLGLSYSSGAGNGLAGMGWNIGAPSIERMTVRGVPEYDLDDTIVSGGELVYIEGTSPRIYRSRFESGFTRFKWNDAGTGANGTWTAEYPDGRVATFTGGIGPTGKTFRWDISESTDVWGHKVSYSYAMMGGTRLLTGITWGEDAQGAHQYSVTLTYEARTDIMVSANAGFEESTAHRLQKVEVKARGTTLRSYNLAYDADAEQNGFTRLSTVTLKGLDGSVFPGIQKFDYSRSLGATCSGTSCGGPYVVEMNSVALGNQLGVNFRNHHATLLDMNGDGLPDIVDTSVAGGKHRIFTNQMAADGDQTYGAPVESAIGLVNEHDFDTPYVQTLDANGDGFVDLMHASTGLILFNNGSGDWSEKKYVWELDESGLPDLEADFEAGDNELRSLRFIDIDNDKKIDMIRSVSTGVNNQVNVYRNVGGGFTGMNATDGVEQIGVGFEDDGLDLNDINGDGLADVVHVTTSLVRYRLSYGRGKWSDWHEAASVALTSAEAEDIELEDMNGDGLSDLVLVKTDRIKIWLNRNGEEFVAQPDIMDADVEGALPAKSETDTVLFADMNGSGTTDIVWLTTSGEVSFVELYPVKPNLMNKIDNGLGMIQEITYATSVSHMAKDPDEWAYRVPFGSIVVDKIDIYDTTTGVHSVRTYDYHDGYFDGVEKMFRGYQNVEETYVGDTSQEEGQIRYSYDVGVEDNYRAGRMLETEVISGGRSLQVQTTSYDDCDVVGVPKNLTPYAVRFVCQTGTTVQLREGLEDESEWAVTKTELRWDDQGNVTTNINHGVVGFGPEGTIACGACERDADEYGEPCGKTCSGDERWVHREFADVDGAGNIDDRWILGLETLERSGPDDGVLDGTGIYSETLTYYDGAPFVGRALGEFEKGSTTRTAVKSDADTWIDVKRTEVDADGNGVIDLDPMGTVDGEAHRVLTTYSADGLRVTRIEVPMTEAEGGYTLRRDYRYDSIWDKVNVSFGWQAVKGEDELSQTTSTTYSYDVFGRVSAIVRPGDAAATPTIAYSYEPGVPSRTLTKLRSVAGGAQDLVHVRCTDGRGRTYQERNMTSPGHYTVNGFSTTTTQGATRDTYQAWSSTSDVCDAAAPENVLKTSIFYDAVGRPLETRLPAVEGETNPKMSSTYGPLWSKSYDLGDNATGYAHADTPTVHRVDGMGRVVAIGRTPAKGAEPEWFTVIYDALGRVARVIDPMGNERTQTWDLLGRITEVNDLDRGTITWKYDSVGHEIEKTDAAGTTRNAFDSAGRVIAKWVDGDEAATKITYQWDLATGCPDDVCDLTGNERVGVSYPSALGQVHEWVGLDARRRVAKIRRVVDTAGGARSFDIDTSYDNIDRTTKTTYPGGIELSYVVDGTERVTSIPGFVDSVVHSAKSEVTELAFANGVTLSQSFDARGRPTAIDLKGPNQNLLAGLTFGRDAAGLIHQVTDRAAPAGEPSSSATFTYDAFARLTSATLDPGADDEETIDYVWDAADNLLERTSSIGDASPEHDGTRVLAEDKAHQVIQVGDQAIAYDDTGKVIARGDTTFDFDGYGRLADARVDGQVVSQHVYAKDSERLWSKSGDETTWFLTDDYMITDGVASLYVRLGGQSVARWEVSAGSLVLPDVNADSDVNAADAWLGYASDRGYIDPVAGGDVDETLAASAAQNLIGFGERKTFFVRDHIDNVDVVTDEDGNVIERTTRYPFGSLRSTTTNDRELMGFTDKLEDEQSGLVHIGLRQYDPMLGRWNAPDYMFESIDAEALQKPWEAMGAYIYANNNPVMGQDEAGAQTWNNDEFAVVTQITNLYVSLYSNKDAYEGTTHAVAVRGAIADLKAMVGSNDPSFGIADAIQFVQVNRQAIANQFVDITLSGDSYDSRIASQNLEAFVKANDAYDAIENEDSEDDDPPAPYVSMSIAKEKPKVNMYGVYDGNFKQNLDSLELADNMEMDNIVDLMSTPSGAAQVNDDVDISNNNNDSNDNNGDDFENESSIEAPQHNVVQQQSIQRSDSQRRGAISGPSKPKKNMFSRLFTRNRSGGGGSNK